MMENDDQTKDNSNGISTEQKTTAPRMDISGNKKHQVNIANVLADHGYLLETVVGGGKVSTIWFGTFNPLKRRGPVPPLLELQTTATLAHSEAIAMETLPTKTTPATAPASSTAAAKSTAMEISIAAAATTTTSAIATATASKPSSNPDRVLREHSLTSMECEIASGATTTTTTTTTTTRATTATAPDPSVAEEVAPESPNASSTMRVAMKVSTGLTNASKKFLLREMGIWRELQHPHVVTVFEVFDMPQGYCITMEATSLGDLLDHIQSQGYFPESDAKRIFLQILSAVDFLHEKDIAHRDLKCENVLMFGEGKFKLTDFGFARYCRDPITNAKVLSETFCGSVPYAAPEVLEGIPYNPKYSDIWSLGVMLYVMLYGCLPLPDENVLELLYKAKDQDIFFPEEPYVSDRAIDLMLLMMEPDILARATVREVNRSPWVCSDDDESSDSSVSPPSIIIQGKQTRRESCVFEMAADQSSGDDAASSKSSLEKDPACCCMEMPADAAVDRDALTRKLTRESAGDSVPDWASFEWSRERQLSSRSSSSESGKQQLFDDNAYNKSI